MNEREYRFSLADESFPAFDELRRGFVKAGLDLAEAPLRLQHDRYFDNRRGGLRRSGWALRQRTQGDKVLAGLKSAGVVSGALHEREEIEMPLENDSWPPAIASKVAEFTSLLTLKPILDLRTRRSPFMVLENGAVIAEIFFDSVSASMPNSEVSISFQEVELEALERSHEENLNRIITVLTKILTLIPSPVNKLERAEALLSLADSLEDG